ncbi:PTS system fructose-specific IIB component [Halarchaeum solikamskense]|uniref:PTS fructose transporter subunit IIB n=1 Tax=Halarchaeum nitratireducens TaxID=489913 RepID=UPI001B3A9E63|nr:PTS fructose transporter subunit IIB [Halarchaeum solikamskense]MBP2250044.1 PTS system fructose-specific IIB component [Halarchaeum solikamskense]
MKLVAITSCPTGIAHSQMAAENLETTAEGMGHDIKVEVQGAMGAENELTAEDIAAADAVIITADTAVKTDRFEGKPVVRGPVKAGVNRADEMVERAVEAANAGKSGIIDEGDAPESETGGSTAADEGTEDGEAAEDGDRPADEPVKRGGDPEKGIFRRLRRWLSG